jgi:hypothetical protein
VRTLTSAAAARGQRPLVLDDPPAELPALVQAESGVTVEHHPGVLLGTEWLEHLSASKEARMNNVIRDYT